MRRPFSRHRSSSVGSYQEGRGGVGGTGYPSFFRHRSSSIGSHNGGDTWEGHQSNNEPTDGPTMNIATGIPVVGQLGTRAPVAARLPPLVEPIESVPPPPNQHHGKGKGGGYHGKGKGGGHGHHYHGKASGGGYWHGGGYYYHP